MRGQAAGALPGVGDHRRQGLNITLVGYLGRLHFGLTSCRELVPDLDMLASYLVDELELLAKAAAPRPAGAARKAK